MQLGGFLSLTEIDPGENNDDQLEKLLQNNLLVGWEVEDSRNAEIWRVKILRFVWMNPSSILKTKTLKPENVVFWTSLHLFEWRRLHFLMNQFFFESFTMNTSPPVNMPFRSGITKIQSFLFTTCSTLVEGFFGGTRPSLQVNVWWTKLWAFVCGVSV